MSAEVTYRTHILIGGRPNGVMTVIADWGHLPKREDVQKEIDAASCLFAALYERIPTAGIERGTGALAHQPRELLLRPLARSLGFLPSSRTTVQSNRADLW